MSSACFGQGSSQKTSLLDTSISGYVTKPVGAQFKASRLKEFWWGIHWRKEWLEPVKFVKFDLDTSLGGLTPTKTGGGHQTKSLRLVDKQGREYVLRTMDKDLSVLVPDEFKGSFLNDIANDQICTAHPYGALVIANLTSSIGALHTNPVIVFVDDKPGLGEFRNDFVNKLCLFEERPSGDGWAGTAFSGYADDLINSEKLFSKLKDNNKNHVDQYAFLKIRLLDMMVNDWDRHADQWSWAAHKKDNHTTYIPFAKDRDQAFSRNDGLFIKVISSPWFIRNLRDFKPGIRDVIGENLAAVSLDQQFMNELTLEQWQAAIKEVRQSLTDSAIHHAVLQMPAEIVNLSGAFVEKTLKQRRDNMMKYGMKYYRVINRKVFIIASDKKEIFVINKIDKKNTEVVIIDVNKEGEQSDTTFHKIFSHEVTKEIYLYGFGGNDEFIYSGLAKNSILIRSFGGDGRDIFIDSTNVHGSGKKSKIYDTKNNCVSLRNIYKIKLTNDTTYTTFTRKSFKFDWWMPLIKPGYNPDDGISIGAGIVFRKQQFHKTPYAWEQSLLVDVSTATGSVSFSYNGIFKQTFGKWDIGMSANLKAPKYILNFYGYGNETVLNGEKKKFFRVRSFGFLANPWIGREWKRSSFKAGLLVQSIKIESTANKFISHAGNITDTSVFSTNYFGGANLSYTYSNLANKKDPSLGFSFHTGAKYLLHFEKQKRNVLNIEGNLKFFLPIAKTLTFAHRTGAATNFGKYEFYQANTVGGIENLRGYWRSRFTGQTSFYQNTELRLQVAKLHGYVLRGHLGIYGFFDDGRVWIEDEHSNKIHVGYGGGIYFIPYNKIALNVSYGVSSEVNVFTVRTGFFF